MKKNASPIEYRTYIDNETGEIHEVPVMHHEKPKNSNFEMIFYGHFLEILGDLGNKKIKILQYIINKREKANNVFIGSIRDIGAALNISITTVNETLMLLEDKMVIRRKTGVIYIDADLVCDGRFKDRIMHVYQEAHKEQTEEEKAANLDREILRLKKETDRLEALKRTRQKFENVSVFDEEDFLLNLNQEIGEA